MTDEYFKTGRGMARRSLDLIEAMRDLAETAQPITGRGIGYKLFTAGLIPSMARSEMARVYRLLKEARERDLIPWDWIVDETRSIERVSTWANPAAYARADSVWTVPAERMKGGKPHRVPLAPPALELLQALPQDGDLIFSDRRLHHSAPLRLLRRLGRTETVHGFRSALRDWASERTAFPYEVCERALAHTTGSQAARAYARSDLLEERRKLMQAWATFLNTPAEAERGATVVPMRASAP